MSALDNSAPALRGGAREYSDYETALAEGERFLSAGHLISAKLAFGRAHGLGHEHTPAHVRAHLGLLRVALAEGRPVHVVTQAALAAGATLFSLGASDC